MTSSPIIITKSGIGTERRNPRIPGVFPSTRFGEQVLSTGIPSLDSFLGGGIPVNTVCLIKDSYPGRYADLILKCFIAEGATYNHHLCLASTRSDLLNHLPYNRKSDAELVVDPGSESTMKIAWRYQTQSLVDGSGGLVDKRSNQNAKFDFSSKSSAEALGAKHVDHFDVIGNYGAGYPESLLRHVLESAKQYESNKQPRNILRVAISHCEEIIRPQFLKSLRAIARHTNCCIVLTASSILLNKETWSRCEQFVDHVITLDAFHEDKSMSELGDVDGVCYFQKLSCLNSLRPIELPRDIGFSFRKKRLAFQILHLNPESETNSSKTGMTTSAISSSAGCGASAKTMDF